MTLSRRDILIAGGAAALAATPITRASAQHAHDGPGAMPTPEEMQTVQRGGLYASMSDPKSTELPPDAFEQRFTFSPAQKAEPAGGCPKRRLCPSRAARWPGRPPKTIGCTSSA